jgi:hypothetical protein
MVTGLDQLSAGDADGFVMSTLLQVQDVVLQSGRSDAPHFVAQVSGAGVARCKGNFCPTVWSPLLTCMEGCVSAGFQWIPATTQCIVAGIFDNHWLCYRNGRRSASPAPPPPSTPTSQA